MLLARRLYPQAANHRLGTLAALHHLPDNGRAHRALADAQTTAQLLLRMQQDLQVLWAAPLAGAPVTHEVLCQVQATPRARLTQAANKGLTFAVPQTARSAKARPR